MIGHIGLSSKNDNSDTLEQIKVGHMKQLQTVDKLKGKKQWLLCIN